LCEYQKDVTKSLFILGIPLRKLLHMMNHGCCHGRAHGKRQSKQLYLLETLICRLRGHRLLHSTECTAQTLATRSLTYAWVCLKSLEPVKNGQLQQTRVVSFDTRSAAIALYGIPQSTKYL
jgi:hypothetical protein